MTDRAVSVQIRDVAGHILSFNSLRSFRQFIDEESSFWDQANNEVGGNTSDLPGFYFINNLRNLKNQINSWEPSIDSWDEQTFNSQLSRTVQECLSASSTYWVWSNQPFVDTYLQCFRDHGMTSARAFVEHIAQRSTGNISNGDWFKGYMLAYEFLNQKSEILKRRHSEKTAITRLRDQFVESRDQLFGETDALKQDFTNWDEKNRSRSTRRLAAQKRLNRIVVKKNDKKFASKLEEMGTELDGWNAKVKSLEDLYEEKLKLQKPAEYWNKAARRYGIQGSLWALAIVAAVVVGLVYFREFFITWLEGKHLPLQLNTLQGVFLFGSIAAVFAFLLRTLSRLTFSAFHLMRDAQEREQLTYLYLSLSNESTVDEKSREIVLQALFSRSETGLLAQENGPTMPGVEILKSAAGKN